ncbi:MAG: hypothetical protein LBE65_06660 [Synergistaceae bacterium]|nr:hypothetical protein [Synergistaceae bacterium]
MKNIKRGADIDVFVLLKKSEDGLPEEKTVISSDAGAAQFVARYGETVASPVVRQAYEDWVLADFRERSMSQGARADGKR